MPSSPFREPQSDGSNVARRCLGAFRLDGDTHTHAPTSASAGVPRCSWALLLRVGHLERVVDVRLLNGWPTAQRPLVHAMVPGALPSFVGGLRLAFVPRRSAFVFSVLGLAASSPVGQSGDPKGELA